MVDLSAMHAYPTAFGMDTEPGEAPDYLELSTEDLAGRCAEAAAGWDDPTKVAALPPPLQPQALFKDPAAHPLVLTLATLDKYGKGAMEWAPEVLRATMLRDNVQLSGQAWTKLLAARVLLASPSPWRQWEAFAWTARGLAGHPPNFSYLELPELGHLAAAADMMKIVDPRRETSTEVDKFTAAALRHEGFCWAPEPLDFAKRALEDPKLSCKQCGALFEDNNDVRCLTCGQNKLEAVPFPLSNVRDHCDALWAPRKALPLERAVDGLGDGAPAFNLVYDWAVQWDYVKRVRQALLGQMRGIAR